MKKQKNKQAIKASKLAKAQNMQNKIITVKNAEGDPDTKAEILIQNKINYTPKVSVIIPVYNVEEYLRECLDSVVNQTLKEIEIICVDDGSTDKSLEILKEYAKKDNRISVFAQSHIGTGKCRNIALSVVKGYYIGFVDPDDWIENEYFEKLYKETIENPVDIVFQTKRIEFNTITQKQVVIGTLKGKNDIEFRYNIIRQSAHLWSKIFNRKFIEKYNLRNAHTQRAQDLLFTVPAILLAKDIKCIENAKYFYRKGHKSACQVEYTEKNFLNSIRLFQDIKDKLSQCGSNAQSLVQLKENLFYKNNLNKLSEVAQQNILKILENKPFIDFELNNHKTKICIKNPAPDSIDKLWWGDYWLGLDLASSLREENYDIRVDYHEQFNFEEDEDINIVIRGLHPCNSLNKTKLNIMYMISCSNKITQQELNQYDIIIVGSLKYQQKLCKKRKHTYYLPQFTNIKRFYPEKNEKYKNQILYVGNAYAGMRPAVQFAVSNDIPISVYGKFWEDKIDNKLIKGQYIDNNELHKYYSNATIVLNDTQVVMKENGFISNRIYDVTACKGFLISDYLPEIEEVYGDSIPMYRNEEEFKNLINYYLAHPEERTAKAEKAYNITINNYTSSIFARKLNTLIEQNKNKLKKMVLLKAIKNKCSLEKNPLNRNVSGYTQELKAWYQRVTGKYLNLDNPRTFNEKIQWLKLYNSTPIKTRLADKYLVRDWVKEKIGEQYLIPLLGVYDKFEDIDFAKLPNQFVIKCNHGCAYNIIVKDKSKLDLAEAKAKLDKWLHENFAFKAGYELHYRDIKPKIIIEKYMEDESGELRDYKFMCFNGKVELILVDQDRYSGHKRNVYDNNWILQKYSDFPNIKEDIKKPNELETIKSLAHNLSKYFNFVRVDFYITNKKIYFGEMTFTPASGTLKFPNYINQKLGNMIKLPKQAYNMDTGEYYKLPKKSKLKPWLLLPYNLLKQKYLQEKYQNAQCQSICRQLKSIRIDVKNFGNTNNAIKIETSAKVFEPEWFSNVQGKGQVVSANKKIQNIIIKAIQNGKLRLDFKGIYKNVDGKNYPLWVDYKSIKINGKEQLTAPVATWHDKPYRFEMPVKDGQVINIEVAQQYHQYTKDELKDVILKLNPNSDYIRQNINRLTDKIYDKITVKPAAPRVKKPKAASNQELLASIAALNARIERLEQENRDRQAQLLAAINTLKKS